MFSHLALGRSSYYNPSGFWESFRDYDGEPINIREHQDAYEFFTRLQVCVCGGGGGMCVGGWVGVGVLQIGGD